MSTTGSYLYTSKVLLPPITANNPDILVIETAELALGIVEIRQAIHFLQIKPIGTSGKMVIIKEAEKMTEEAQNCLLKTLEEPPENTTIVLLAPDPDRLLPTVVSRCRIVTGDEERETLPTEDEIKMAEIFTKREKLVEQAMTDRKTALDWIRKALIYCHGDVLRWHCQARALLAAQKYLRANTNVRLTMENLLLKM